MKKNEIYEKRIKILIFGCMIFAIYIIYVAMGRDIYKGLRVPYLDDLGTYNFYSNNELSFWDKVTSIGGNRVRYVLRFILTIFFEIVGKNCERIDNLLLAWNIIIAVLFMIISFWLFEEKDFKIRCIFAFGSTLMYSFSRFSYYTFTEVLGLMESSALILSILLVALLIKDNFEYKKKWWIACCIYFIILWIHERYCGLIGVLCIYIFFGFLLQKNLMNFIKKSIGVLMIFIFYFCIRFFLFGNQLLEGTGGTNIKETFNILTFFRHMIYQIGYLCGVNAPKNEYLNGIEPGNVKKYIYIFTFALICMYLFTFANYLKSYKTSKNHIYKIFIFYSAITCMVISSSVTIRVEMRWLYSSYAVLILSFFYMLCAQKNKDKSKSFMIYTIIFFSIISTYFQENYYKQFWHKLYYWADRELSSSLVDTLGSDKKIEKLTIVFENGDFSNWNEEKIKQVVRTYNIEIDKVEFCNNIYETDGTGWILLKNKSTNSFTNISKTGKNAFNVIGWYDDGWIEPYTHIQIANIDCNTLILEFYSPNELANNNHAEFFINGESVQQVSLLDSELNIVEISDIPKGRINLEINCDFYTVENSGRSEEGKLSCVLRSIELK